MHGPARAARGVSLEDGIGHREHRVAPQRDGSGGMGVGRVGDVILEQAVVANRQRYRIGCRVAVRVDGTAVAARRSAAVLHGRALERKGTLVDQVDAARRGAAVEHGVDDGDVGQRQYLEVSARSSRERVAVALDENFAGLVDIDRAVEREVLADDDRAFGVAIARDCGDRSLQLAEIRYRNIGHGERADAIADGRLGVRTALSLRNGCSIRCQPKLVCRRSGLTRSNLFGTLAPIDRIGIRRARKGYKRYSEERREEKRKRFPHWC